MSSVYEKNEAVARRLAFHERHHRQGLEQNIQDNPSSLWRHLRSSIGFITQRFVATDNPMAVFEIDLHECWETFVEAAKLIDSKDPAADRLVAQVLVAREMGQVRRMNPPADISGHREGEGQIRVIEEAITGSGERMWTDLPFFAADMRSFWVELDPTWTPGERQNVAGVCGRLSAAGVCNGDITSLALIPFRKALEFPTHLESSAMEDQGLSPPAVLLDYLPAVVAWLQNGTYPILKLCMQNYTPRAQRLTEACDWARAGPLLQDAAGSENQAELGFSMRRWYFWEKRLGELKVASSDPETAKQIQICLNFIARFEEVTGGFVSSGQREIQKANQRAFFLGQLE